MNRSILTAAQQARLDYFARSGDLDTGVVHFLVELDKPELLALARRAGIKTFPSWTSVRLVRELRPRLGGRAEM